MLGPVLVLHSTEGSSIAGAVATMRRNRSESNWVTDPYTGETVTLKSTSSGDRSLRNRAGGVETNNRLWVWQLEIVGFAELIPFRSEEWYIQLGATVTELCDEHGIPKVFPCGFRPYPASYGLRAPQRLTGAQWMDLAGIVGHQHVPENDHGDPGDISRLIPYVQGATTRPKPTPPAVDLAAFHLLEPAMPLPADTQLSWSLLDLAQCSARVDDLFRTWRPEPRPVLDGDSNPTPEWKAWVERHQADCQAWGQDLSAKLERGTDPRPTLAYIAWRLREEHEAKDG